MGMLRTLLALAVALSHGNGVFGYSIYPGDYAVQVFYVISGFLISLILLTKYEANARGNWLFYSNRALRIFVPYWTVLIGAAAVSALLYATAGREATFSAWLPTNDLGLTSRIFLIFTNLFIVGQDLCLWLLSDGGTLKFSNSALLDTRNASSFNVITPAWTLAVELMFYAIAPFLVRRHVLLILTVATLSIAAKFGAKSYGFWGPAFEYRFFPFELGLFLAGSLSYRLYKFLHDRDLIYPYLALGASALVIGLLLFNTFAPTFFQKPYVYFTVVAICLPSLFKISQRFKTDRWIGELSYPIYLIHWPVQRSLGEMVLPGDLRTALSFGLTIALSILLVRYISEPLDKWRERRVREPSSSPKPVALTATG